MLFNSLEFIVFFLPFSLIAFFSLARFQRHYALVFLTVLSAVFVGWKNPAFFYLIFTSILVNYLFFQCQLKAKRRNTKRLFFTCAVLFNVFYLFYFKYFNFSIQTLNFFFDSRFEMKDILLPLAISFYTFQQISFLHDALNEKVGQTSLLRYAFFVLFFPQLIAGPIIRHNELIPVTSDEGFYKPNYVNLAVGLSIFTFGFFKKVVFADTAATLVDPIYAHIVQGGKVSFYESWLAIFGFSFQIYFDFSGYSDMAVGLGRMFNVKFPQNFNSPYQSVSIIDFWRRWHISLSTFLKENLYIPLGGGKKGVSRKVANLMITMLLGGLWHGASWTFVVWGGIHGFCLSINHLFKKKNAGQEDPYALRLCKQIFVFLLVSLAWIFFRAESFGSALEMFKGAFGANGLKAFSNVSILEDVPLHFTFIFLLYAVVLFFPNTFDWHFNFEPSLDYEPSSLLRKKFFKRFLWKPSKVWAVLILLLLFYSFGYVNNEQEFIYFQF